MHNLLLEEQNNNNNNKQQSQKNKRLDRVDIYPQIVMSLIQKKMHQLNQKLQNLVKEFLTTKLYSSQVQIQNLEDLIVDSSDTLKYEKSVNLKLQSKINILQNQLSISELQRQDVKENLSKLNSKSNKILDRVGKSIYSKMKKIYCWDIRKCLQEVYKLRGMISQMEADQNNYQATLKQVRTFMDTIDWKPI